MTNIIDIICNFYNLFIRFFYELNIESKKLLNKYGGYDDNLD